MDIDDIEMNPDNVVETLLSLVDENGNQFFNKEWVLKRYGK